ncbi:MAG: hypothetical protein COA78_30475 [Blastopirellula sp.]|nr:MAG: hypothetical protein COA78_30475 [Blastopirellula sp.]
MVGGPNAVSVMHVGRCLKFGPKNNAACSFPFASWHESFDDNRPVNATPRTGCSTPCGNDDRRLGKGLGRPRHTWGLAHRQGAMRQCLIEQICDPARIDRIRVEALL